MPARRLPYLIVASPGRAEQCLRCLRAGCGRHRLNWACRGRSTPANNGAALAPRGHEWLVDVVEAEPGYRLVVGSVRGREAQRRRSRRARELPPLVEELAGALAERRGETIWRVLGEADEVSRGNRSRVFSYDCRSTQGRRLRRGLVVAGLALIAIELLKGDGYGQ